jgi:hypothetical protein
MANLGEIVSVIYFSALSYYSQHTQTSEKCKTLIGIFSALAKLQTIFLIHATTLSLTTFTHYTI